MPKVNKYAEIVFLILLVALAINSCYRYFSFGYALSITNYLGFIAVLYVVGYKLISIKEKPNLVFILLFLGTFNIIRFTNEAITANVGFGKSGFELPSFNPLLFILFGIYCGINRSLTLYIWRKIFKPSDHEVKDKHEVMVKFYHGKFSLMEPQEFETTLNKLKEYPVEAQVALQKIQQERNIS